MILHGSFSVMSLEEVLQWVGLARKSGRLAVHHSGATTHLFFDEGTIIACVTNDPPKLLGQFLVFLGLIDTAQLREAMGEHRSAGKPLSEVLLARGWIDAEQLVVAVRSKAEETLFGLFDLDDATFTFEPGVNPADKSMSVGIRAEDLLLRGIQRFDENSLIRDVFPDHRFIVRRTADESRRETLSNPIHRRIYDVIDGQLSISDIILHVHGSEFLVTRALLELYREGLIETVAPTRPAAEQPDADTDQAGHDEDPIEAIRRAGLDPADCPLLVTDRQALTQGPISAAEEFLVNLCDGSWEIEELIWVTPLSPSEIARAVVRLVERGTLQIRNAQNITERRSTSEDSQAANAG